VASKPTSGGPAAAGLAPSQCLFVAFSALQQVTRKLSCLGTKSQGGITGARARLKLQDSLR
jgi:hypothetical protein